MRLDLYYKINIAGMEKRCLVSLISWKTCSSILHPATNMLPSTKRLGPHTFNVKMHGSNPAGSTNNPIKLNIEK